MCFPSLPPQPISLPSLAHRLLGACPCRCLPPPPPSRPPPPPRPAHPRKPARHPRHRLRRPPPAAPARGRRCAARPHSGQRPIVRRSRPHLRQDCAATAVLPRAGPRTCPAGLRRPGGTQDPRPALRGAPRGHPLTGRGRPRWTSSVLDVVNGLIP